MNSLVEDPEISDYNTNKGGTVSTANMLDYRNPDSCITLNPNELKLAANIGVTRQVLAITNAAKTGYTGPGYTMQVEGACGELAVCKYFNIYYKPIIDTYSFKPAVAQLEIRTSLMAIPHLVIRQSDLKSKNPFVLVASNTPKYYLLGWIFAQDALKEEYYRKTEGRPAVYLVPWYKLNFIDGISEEYLEDANTEEFNH